MMTIDLPTSVSKEPPDGLADSEMKNKGKLSWDATCAPADIAYPTDLGLLKEIREKLEHIMHKPLQRGTEKAMHLQDKGPLKPIGSGDRHSYFMYTVKHNIFLHLYIMRIQGNKGMIL
ncbi:hypothetical protein [Heyndrickxia coagulans]|uniref:hypothetical protein n=1 Tax=Heyndrickxia coagulans TaxID=1398 RepID=UPI0005A2B02D|nr:hypothetical protein [Heyndrickxia coagulans]